MKQNPSHYIEERLTGLTRQAGAVLCAAALLVAAALCLPSCTNEPIFATIENEIELRDPNLEGTVPSVVQYYDGSNYWLFACNGYVKRKLGSADPGSWETVSTPGGRCGKLVAATDSNGDSIGLFALAQSDSWAFYGLYQYDDDGGWDSISLPSGATAIHEIGPSTNGFYAIEHTGSAAEDNVSTEFTVYEYDGSSWTELSGSLDSAPIGMGGNYMVTKRRPYKVESGSISAMTTDDSDVYVSGYGYLLPGNEYDIMGMCVNPQTPTHLYVLTDDYLWHYNGSTWTGRTSTGTSSYDGFGAPAYFAGSQPLVLMPLEEGYREAVINSSNGQITGTQTVGTSSSSSVATSARSQYRSSIEDYAINFMFAVTDTDYLPAGCSYAVYASVGHYKYSGLWGYYEGVQEEWNRE